MRSGGGVEAGFASVIAMGEEQRAWTGGTGLEEEKCDSVLARTDDVRGSVAGIATRAGCRG